MAEMSMIEGVGDEVTLFVAVVFVTVILVLAWLSTQVNNRFPVNVIVLDRVTFYNLLRRLQRRGVRDNRPAAAAGSETVVVAEESQSQERRESDADTTAVPGETAGQSEAAPSTVPVSDTSGLGSTEAQQLSPQTLSSTTAESSDITSTDTATDDTSSQNVSLVTSQDSEITSGLDTSTGLRQRIRASTKTSTVQADFTTENSVPETENVQTESGEVNVSSPPDTETEASLSENAEGDDGITIRIKFLNDQQRVVRGLPEETIGDFKRRHFAAELADNTAVRFIFNGQELRQDSSTLQAYNVQHNSVIHCLLSHNTPPPQTQQRHGQGQDLDLSILMFPLFALILALIWYCRFTYRTYFNAMSTFSLIGITFLFLVAAMAAWRPAAAAPEQEHED